MKAWLAVLGMAMAAAAGAAPVEIQRSFHRAGQTYLLWAENAGAGQGYHVYRSLQPITSDTIAGLEPLTLNGTPLVVPQGSATLSLCSRLYNPKPYPDNLLPEQVYDFSWISRWFVDDLPRTQLGASSEAVAEGTGMLVWTPGSDPAWQKDGPAWYAVTEAGSRELGPASVVRVEERHERLEPLLVWQSPTGKTRLFLQYMALRREDGVDWNPSEFGYAFFYSVEVPEDYDYSRPEKLAVYFQLHAGGAQSLPSELRSHSRFVRITPTDRYSTWWYGWEMRHDYRGVRRRWKPSDPADVTCIQSTEFAGPTTGVIVNYMEQAALRPLFDIADDGQYALDEDRVFVEGGSMGASGAMQFGLRYPKLFSAAIADKPPVNPRLASAPGPTCHVRVEDPISLCNQPFDFQRLQFDPMWGTVAANLPVVNQSPWLGPTSREPAAKDIEEYNGLGVYDWMDLGMMMSGKRLDAEGNIVGIQLPNMLGRETAFFHLTSGYRDCAASWDTQGRPIWAQLERARVGHAGYAQDIPHALERNNQKEPWPEFVPPPFSFVSAAFPMTCTDSRWVSCFTVPRTQSFPALTYSSSATLPIGRQTPTPFRECPNFGDPESPEVIPPVFFHLNVVWDGEGPAAPRDEPELWAMTLRTVTVEAAGESLAAAPVLVNVTPRRTQQFRPEPGTRLYYLVEVPGRLPVLGIVPWKDRLPTVPGVLITAEGTRLTLSVERPATAAGPVGWEMR